MLLLLTTLALAQDPAPEGEVETTSSAESAPSELPAEPSPAASTESAETDDAKIEAPTETSEAPESAAEPAPEGWSGESGDAEPELAVEVAAEPVQVDPALWGSYEEGYSAGLDAAEELADWIQPAVAGAGIGAGAAGLGVVCGGLVCGAPAVLGGAGYQAYKTRKDVPPPPPGAWQQRSAEFQTGFIQGFQARANQKRTRWALAGGATGAVVGTGMGLIVVAVLYDRQGRDFL